MTDSIRLGRILGIPIGINWSIVAVAVFFTAGLAVQALPRSVPDSSLGLRVAAAAIAVLVFFASILAHELGHAVAALGHGVGVHGITLWLLGGVAKLDRQAPSARAEFQIAVAGPAVSFALGIFFVALTVIAIAVLEAPLAVAVLAWLGLVNIVLAVFNLLPAAPLDGGRVLTAALWKRLGNAEQARIISGRCGLFLAIALITIGVVQLMVFEQFGGWVTALVGGFSFTAARAEIAAAAVRRRLLDTEVGRLAVRHPPSVPDTITVTQLLEWAGPDGANTAHPVTRWGPEPIGYVVPADLATLLTGPERSWTQIREIMHRPTDVECVGTSDSVDSLLRRWEAGAASLALVANHAGGPSFATITDHQVRPLLVSPNLWGGERAAKPPLVVGGPRPAVQEVPAAQPGAGPGSRR